MKLLKISIVMLLCLSSAAFAQDWKQKMEEQQKRIERKRQAQQERVDLRFANQLKRIWLQMDLEEGMDIPKIVEPDNPRVYDPSQDNNIQDVQLRILPSEEDLMPKGRQEPKLRIAPVEEVDEEVEIEENEEIKEEINFLEGTMRTSYFGSSVDLRYDPAMRFGIDGRITEYKIANAWKRLESTAAWKPLFIILCFFTVAFVFTLVVDLMFQYMLAAGQGGKPAPPAFQSLLLFIMLMQPPVIIFQRRPELLD